jgi:chaperonin GroES
MKVKPIRDRVIILPIQGESITSSGIIIPDSAKEKPQRGKVMAVGDGTLDEPMCVKVGDEVIYGKFSGADIEVDGSSYIIMRQTEIFAVL